MTVCFPPKADFRIRPKADIALGALPRHSVGYEWLESSTEGGGAKASAGEVGVITRVLGGVLVCLGAAVFYLVETNAPRLYVHAVTWTTFALTIGVFLLHIANTRAR